MAAEQRERFGRKSEIEEHLSERSWSSIEEGFPVMAKTKRKALLSAITRR